MPRKLISVLVLMLSALSYSSRAADGEGPSEQSRFIGISDFTGFTAGFSSNTDERVLLSPMIKAPMAWNELVVSWNAATPPEAWLKVEARGVFPDHETQFYGMGIWSKNSAQQHPQGSVSGQKDADGRVNNDTLVLVRSGADVQLRLTLGGLGEARPRLKFLGLSFLDNRAKLAPLPPNRAAWGKIIPTPERSQDSYPQAEGWCSPASLAMVLTRWGGALHRPDLEVGVPEVAAGVYDRALGGAGNWTFNTAYAGSFPNMRAYVARLSDLSEVEDWIAAGIPVVISAPWHLLSPGRRDTGSGHLSVCIGFTENGDVVINDPAANLQKGQKVRHIYMRQNVINAWQQSHNTVYLVYPATAQIPADHFGHWEKR